MNTSPTPIEPGSTPHTPTVPPPARSRARRVYWLLLVLLVLVVAGGAAAVWRWSRSEPVAEPILDPPMPAGIQEPAVVEALQSKRAEVLASPKSADAWGEYGMALQAQLFHREADVCFAEASRLDPQDPRWPYTRGHVAVKVDPPRAAGLLRQAIATSGPGDKYRTAARLLLAEIRMEEGYVDEAATLFTQELGPPPGQPRAALGLAMVAMARGDEATAVRYLTPLLTNEHAKKQANVLLARLARARGDTAAAERFDSAAALLPEPTAWPDPMFDVIPTLAVGRRGRDRLLLFLELQHRYTEAIDTYLADLAEERTPKALIGAGINYLRRGNTRDAQPGDYELAIAYMREAVQVDPNSPIANYNLALVLFTLAEREADRNPTSAQARKWFEEVVVYAQKTTKLKRDHARGYLFWGLALKHLGDPKGAVKPFRDGIGAQQDNFELHIALGQVLAAIGETAEAEKCFENARQLDPKDPRPARELQKLREKK